MFLVRRLTLAFVLVAFLSTVRNLIPHQDIMLVILPLFWRQIGVGTSDHQAGAPSGPLMIIDWPEPGIGRPQLGQGGPEAAGAGTDAKGSLTEES